MRFRPTIVWGIVGLILLAAWCNVSAQSVLVTQTVRSIDPLHRDSAVTVLGVLRYPRTFSRSRVRATVCMQVDSTTARWLCSTRTDPWIVADSEHLVKAVVTFPVASRSEASTDAEGFYTPLCAWLRFVDGQIRRASNSPPSCDTTAFSRTLRASRP